MRDGCCGARLGCAPDLCLSFEADDDWGETGNAMSVRVTRLVGVLALAGCSAATAGSTGWQDIRTGVIYFQSVRCEPEGTKCLVP